MDRAVQDHGILGSCTLSTIQSILTKELNDHWMKNLYFSSFCLEKYRNDMSIELNYGILCFFKNSNYVMNQIAHSFYNNQGTDCLVKSSISASNGSRNC